jgi:flagellar hook-associated protein 3 FlgL
MRITQNQMIADGLASVQAAESSTASLQNQVSSGKKINQASDDPAGAGRLVRLDAEIAANGTAQANATTASTDLGAADSALEQLSTVLSQASELATEGANGALTASDRAALASQASGLLQDALGLANTTVDGRAIFGGTATRTTPYSVASANGATQVTYSGNAVAREVPVGTTTIVTGTPGPGPFAASGGVPGALDAIAALRDALQGNGGVAAVQGTISGLTAATSAAASAVAVVGSSMNDVTFAQSGLATQLTQLQTVQSAVGDVDVASAMTALQQQQNTYQEGLDVLAKIMSTTSILNYLPTTT